MKLKYNVSLSLKITLIVVFLSAIFIFGIAYINTMERSTFFPNAYNEKATALSQALDTSITFNELLNDSVMLQQFIENFSANNPELLTLNVYLLNEEEELILQHSDDLDTIGAPVDPYYAAYHHNSSKTGNIFFDSPPYGRESQNVLIIAPVNLSGTIHGTYEMILSMEATYTSYWNFVKLQILVSSLSLFFLILISLFLLRKVIVKPIIAFRDASKKIGRGNLNERISIDSHDELGDLATSFNQMTRDLKESRSKIQRYSKTLEKLLKQKDEFIGQLGHDLKNPLTPLVGLLPMIVEQEKDPKLKEHLQLIHGNVSYMQELIFKTLKLAKLRSENVQFDFESLDLTGVITEVVNTQKIVVKDHNIRLVNNVQQSILVHADKLRLIEVFNNLISNSVKYTPESGGTITIDATLSKDMVTVSVSDTGIGMTKKQQEMIFDEFYKADKASDETASSGLGLSIVKRIIEKHDGKIWVESEGPGKGSTFYFTLKLVKGKN